MTEIFVQCNKPGLNRQLEDQKLNTNFSFKFLAALFLVLKFQQQYLAALNTQHKFDRQKFLSRINSGGGLRFDYLLVKIIIKLIFTEDHTGSKRPLMWCCAPNTFFIRFYTSRLSALNTQIDYYLKILNSHFLSGGTCGATCNKQIR